MAQVEDSTVEARWISYTEGSGEDKRADYQRGLRGGGGGAERGAERQGVQNLASADQTKRPGEAEGRCSVHTAGGRGEVRWEPGLRKSVEVGRARELKETSNRGVARQPWRQGGKDM